MLFGTRQKIAILLILAYVTSGILIAVSHHDGTELSSRSTASVSTHGCGSNERHIPIDKRHECLACMQSAMRTATPATTGSVTAVQFMFVGSEPVGDERALSTDILYSGKRGPPIFS